MNPTRGRAAAVQEFLAAACAAGLLVTACWLFSAAGQLVSGAAEELVVRAVLREETTPDAAAALAERLQREEPLMSVGVVGPEEARSRLALQEGWMRNLPEVELVDLPTVLEIRHPEALEERDALPGLAARLEQRSEVQFVQFNEMGLQSLSRLAEQVRNTAGAVLMIFAFGTVLLYALLAANLGGACRRGRALVAALLGAGAGGGLVLLLSEFGNSALGKVPGVPILPAAGVVAGLLVLRGLLLLVGDLPDREAFHA